MAQNVNSYTINGTNIIIKVSDYVRIRSNDPKPYTLVARVELLGIEHQMALIRWYYLPEETEQGRKSFHGIKEVFLSNHYDVQSIHTIQRRMLYCECEMPYNPDLFIVQCDGCKCRYILSKYHQ
ncbi:putative BAH domain, Zinc finger, FYVE/PHD-type [Helianthus annuus]|nr:putative BAH domain, Zinc finger, FYVE/PHD-type [Helianthus annuus]